MPKTEFDYYYGVEAEQFTFVRVPKVLFTDKEHFGGLSNEAKLLYGLLLERMSLSRKNNWIDKHNRVYIIFLPVEEIEESLDVGHEKALNLLKELDDQSGIGLVKKKCRGLGLPSILYVKNFIVKGEQNTDRVPTSRSTENEFQEFGKTDFKKSENQTSENPKNRLLEVRKSDSNNIDILVKQQSKKLFRDPKASMKILCPNVRMQGGFRLLPECHIQEYSLHFQFLRISYLLHSECLQSCNYLDFSLCIS